MTCWTTTAGSSLQSARSHSKMHARAVVCALALAAASASVFTTPTIDSAFAARHTDRWRALASPPALPPSTTDSNLTCSACEFIVSIAMDIAGNATTIAEVKALIEQGCTVIGDPTVQGLCTAVLDGLLEVLPFLDQQLETLAWDIPLGFCATFFPVCTLPCCDSPTTPEQVHLALAGDTAGWRPDWMTVQWVTLNSTATSTVQYGPGNGTSVLPMTITGTTSTYTQGGWLGVIHTAVMTGLTPGQAYSYRVGDEAAGWSPIRTFATLPADVGSPARPLRIAQIGDMAYDNASDLTVSTLTTLAQAGSFDLLMHIGDISYADGFMSHWDMFMRKVEPIVSIVPQVAVRGNHELWYNFSAFKARIAMPPAVEYPAPGGGSGTVGGPNNSSHFSLTIGPVHMTLFNTETALDTADVDPAQLQWLTADLTAAAANRSAVPWLLLGAHRPLYCTNGGKDCDTFAPILRALSESLFVNTKVDLVLAAHMHGYERTWPVANGTAWTGGGGSSNYTSAPYPAYIVNGAAGNREGNENPAGNAPWSVPGAHTDARGYGLLEVVAGLPGPHPNAMTYTFFAANGTAMDTVTLYK